MGQYIAIYRKHRYRYTGYIADIDIIPSYRRFRDIGFSIPFWWQLKICNFWIILSFCRLFNINLKTRNAFCGTWYLPHSHVHAHNERTVPIIMAGCIAYARNGRISTSGEKSDVTIVFPDPDFLNDAKILSIRP